MSALFRRVSWQHNVERFDELRGAAKLAGMRLTLKNASRKRGLPIFVFYLDRKDGNIAESFSDLDEVASAIGGAR